MFSACIQQLHILKYVLSALSPALSPVSEVCVVLGNWFIVSLYTAVLRCQVGCAWRC